MWCRPPASRKTAGFSRTLSSHVPGPPKPFITSIDVPPTRLVHVASTRAKDGLWWGYWWAGPWYPTWTALALLRSLDQPLPAFDPATEWPRPRTALETAFLAGVLHQWNVPQLRDRLITAIIERQEMDGQWEGGFDLRVTNPDCDDPWERSDSGVLYRDQMSTVTTASVLRMLAEVSA